jgi:hypothetical protein
MAAGCLLVLGVCLASPGRWADVRQDLHRLRRALADEPAPAGSGGFWFDPGFADFLEDVKRLTPPDATVAVLVPAHPDLYRYQALYQLAPRRTVDEPLRGEANFVAAYGRRPCGAGKHVAVRGGELCSQ